MNEELDRETSGAKPGRPARLQMPVVKLGTPIHSPALPPDASEVDAASALVAMSGEGHVEAANALISISRGGHEGLPKSPSEHIEKACAYDSRSRDGGDRGR